MGRALLIVAIVGTLMAGGVALAASAGEVRLPVTVETEPLETAPHEAIVVPGDHLWKISARHLQRYAPDQRVAPYWRDVVEENQPHLRSGDPDLIYPGEVIELPAVNERR